MAVMVQDHLPVSTARLERARKDLAGKAVPHTLVAEAAAEAAVMTAMAEMMIGIPPMIPTIGKLITDTCGEPFTERVSTQLTKANPNRRAGVSQCHAHYHFAIGKTKSCIGVLVSQHQIT